MLSGRLPFGALSPLLFGDFICISLIFVSILKSFYCSRLSYDPSNGL